MQLVMCISIVFVRFDGRVCAVIEKKIANGLLRVKT